MIFIIMRSRQVLHQMLIYMHTEILILNVCIKDKWILLVTLYTKILDISCLFTHTKVYYFCTHRNMNITYQSPQAHIDKIVIPLKFL